MKRFAHTAPLLAIAAALVAPAAGGAATKDLWATVNICDTKHHPNSLGVRARMPGTGNRGRMYMRFVAQYRDGTRWRQVDSRSASRWLFAGSSLFVNRETGYTFRFKTPPKGVSYLMRGVVKFQWRVFRKRHWHVVRSAQRVTRGGHRSAGADPARYSAATCRIR